MSLKVENSESSIRLSVSGEKQKDDTRCTTLLMSEVDVCGLVDSGAEVNLIGEDTF